MTHDPTPVLPGRRKRLPDYFAAGPLHLMMRYAGLDGSAPRDVLLAAAYRLAARLERRTEPWDAESDDLFGSSTSSRLDVGPYSVRLNAVIDRAGGAR
ncbi:hypothetical protein ABT093_20775 [Kitasatospora sp. NPDC002551]|uniref:hypothetical protein n=1 Tax=Kitasatospora sp. NPDC002551 TaxID=3154539 RepID=UPI00331AFCBC